MDESDADSVPGRRRRRRGGNAPTLKDVAADAGVAMITVSRAINTPGAVSPQLRDRIGASIRRLGYVANRSAGSLASVRSQLIAVIVPSLSSMVFTDIVRGCSDVLSPHGYQILVSNTSYSLQDEEAVCTKVLGWRPDGVLVAGIDHSAQTRALLAGAGVPVLELLELGANPIDINVGLSHLDAGRAVAGFLIERGYRRPGFIGAQMDLDFRAQRRFAGFSGALAEAGIALRYTGTHAQPPSLATGAAALRELLRAGVDLDAVFCVNDELAIGAMFECKRSGIDVPGRLAIMGFNDLEISAQVVPSLTTIRSPRERMGRIAAQAILQRVAGEPGPRGPVDVGFEVIVRESA